MEANAAVASSQSEILVLRQVRRAPLCSLGVLACGMCSCGVIGTGCLLAGWFLWPQRGALSRTSPEWYLTNLHRWHILSLLQSEAQLRQQLAVANGRSGGSGLEALRSSVSQLRSAVGEEALAETAALRQQLADARQSLLESQQEVAALRAALAEAQVRVRQRFASQQQMLTIC